MVGMIVVKVFNMSDVLAETVAQRGNGCAE